MKIVLLTHATFFKSKSMPKFAEMLISGYKKDNHDVLVYSPIPFFFKLSRIFPFLSKWLGYIDQLLLFPIFLRYKISKLAYDDTIFVFCDQALGPWVPLLRNRPHAIHVHDLLALKSSLDLEPINKTNFTGKIYQKYIRKGFEAGSVFISVSNKTKQDLEDFTEVNPKISKVIFNGLNYPYRKLNTTQTADTIKKKYKLPFKGYLLNVGSNQWYKNRVGLLHLFRNYIKITSQPLSLVIVGPPPTKQESILINSFNKSRENLLIQFLSDVSNETLNALYSGARCTLIPSHEEGFGWPIIESQASGTCVITTNTPPMTEIAGEHSYFLPSTKEFRDGKIELWAEKSVDTLTDFLHLSTIRRAELEAKSIEWANKFSDKKTLSLYLKTYREALNIYKKP